MTKTVVSLQDRFDQQSGQVFLSSMQALVRLPLDQARRDKAAGHKTAGYITGYRGSPITTLDAQLWSAKKMLDAHHIHFEPGLNEELAATSLRGTQQLQWFGKSPYDGVFSMWYAKGLGVDRACEALKLANFEGCSALGGGLIIAGDDHAAKSSASAHQSEHTLIVGFIPVLAPATTDEILLFGQLGWEMSRYSGLYVGMKTVTDALDLTSSILLPEFSLLRPERSGPSLNLQRSMPALQQEAMVLNHRLPAAIDFARANGLDRMLFAARQTKLAILTAGKPYLDLREALEDLGLDDARCDALGISIIKLGMTWPIDPDFVRAACHDAREILVIEEKRPLIEEQLATALYGLDQRPVISGKRDARGNILFPLDNVIDAAMVRRAIVGRMRALDLADNALLARAAELDHIEEQAVMANIAARPAFFCSGCPHNTSTNVPDGSFALGATGCHGLAAFMPERRTMNVVGMGAEGLPWVGAHRFVETEHVFSNMGDGTYTHSGLLAIRAAVAAKANITFKILYNDAVAMTGGQPLEGNIQPDQIVRELLAEAVTPVVMVSDDPDKWRGKLPPEVAIHHRDELDAVQRSLREKPGVSSIIYEQTCANEKRRRRKRGNYPDPDLRLYINPAVCEGCGDCSRHSNCVSVAPLETELGRKRAIDQSNCNKDYSCVNGFCPSFVNVRGAKLAKRSMDMAGLQPLLAQLPSPAVADVSAGYAMLITGIGGTGVLTVGAILGMAAHIEGKAAKVLDMTGMAQKGGGVMSHVRFAASPEAIASARLGMGKSDLLIACDLVVASGSEVTRTLKQASHVIANSDVVPTGEFQTKADIDFSADRFLPALAARVTPGNIALINANDLARKLMGDTIFTNLMMVGAAAQLGLLPVGLEAVEDAVTLNGTAVKANLQALHLGRLAVADPDALLRFAGLENPSRTAPQSYADIVSSRSALLQKFQGAALVESYRDILRQVESKLAARGLHNGERFMLSAAQQLARLMAYKDEYEVARLYVDPTFQEQMSAQFEGDFKISVNLAPPLLAFRKNARTGNPRKIEFGAWIFPVFRFLAKMKGLRGTPFDIFGYTAERKMERALITEYRDWILWLADNCPEDQWALAEEGAACAGRIAGYGPVKEAGVATFHARKAALQEEITTPQRIDESASRPLVAA